MDVALIGNVHVTQLLKCGDICMMLVLGKRETDEATFFYFGSVLPTNVPRGTDVRQHFCARPRTSLGCAVCGAQQPSKLCGKCHGPSYCSVSCQRTHWPAHKGECVAKLSAADFWKWFTTGKCSLLNGGCTVIIQSLLDRGVNVTCGADRVVAVKTVHSRLLQLQKEVVMVFGQPLPQSVPAAADYQTRDMDRLQHLPPFILSLCGQTCHDVARCTNREHLGAHDFCVLELDTGAQYVLDLAGPQYGFDDLSDALLPFICEPLEQYCRERGIAQTGEEPGPKYLADMLVQRSFQLSPQHAQAEAMMSVVEQSVLTLRRATIKK